jgi:kynurenine formamidase
LNADTQVFPGDPRPSVEPAATVSADGYNVARVQLGSHSGTHADAPYHFLEGGERVDAMDLRLFVGPGEILDLRGKGPRERITEGDLRPHAHRLRSNVIAVLRTGWDEHFGADRYLDHPFLDASAASFLLANGVRSLAIDALNVDETVPDNEPADGYPAHEILLGAGGTIAENLTNLGAVDFTEPLFSILPIKLGGADGAPVRAVAMEVLP